jgi:hypothetical protein
MARIYVEGDDDDQGNIIPMNPDVDPPEPPPERKAKLKLSGAYAILQAISISKIHKGDEERKIGVVLTFSVPIDDDDEFPLKESVIEIRDKSEEAGGEGKRTDQVRIRRNYEPIEINLDDPIRKTNVSAPAFIEGTPVVTVLDGDADMKIRVTATLKLEDLEAVLWVLGTESNWAFTPSQGTIPGVDDED